MGLVTETSVGMYLFVYEAFLGCLRIPAPSARMETAACRRSVCVDGGSAGVAVGGGSSHFHAIGNIRCPVS